MIDWDFIVSFVIILALILVIWARVTNQTVPEVIRDIKDIFTGGAEEVQERGEQVIMYE